MVETHGTVLGLQVDSAQPNERQLVSATLNSIRVPQKRGRPRTRPRRLVADRNFDGQALRQQLRRRGIQPCIPRQPKPWRKRPLRGRPLQLQPWYRGRWVVERTFAWLQTYRRLVVRYERHLHCYVGFCFLALIHLCIRTILK